MRAIEGVPPEKQRLYRAYIPSGVTSVRMMSPPVDAFFSGGESDDFGAPGSGFKGRSSGFAAALPVGICRADDAS